MANRFRPWAGVVGVFVALAVAPAAATPGDILASFPAPAPQPTSLTWADGNLYCYCDTAPYNIWKIQPATGSVLGSFRFAKTAGDTVGLAYDGKYFWAGNAVDNVVYRFAWGGSVVSSFKATWDVGHGFACSDSHLWGTERASESNYHLYQMRRDGLVIRSYNFYYDMFDPAWDGRYIWFPDYDDIAYIYRVVCYDPYLGDVLTTFNSPATEGRGLTYGGSYLWLSTLADNGWVWKIDSGNLAVEPASLGRLKALYR